MNIALWRPVSNGYCLFFHSSFEFFFKVFDEEVQNEIAGYYIQLRGKLGGEGGSGWK